MGLRGAGSALYESEWRLPDGTKEHVLQFVENCLRDKEFGKRWVSRLSLQLEIEDFTGITCSFPRITRLAREWGLVHAVVKPLGPKEQALLRTVERRHYIIKLREAIERGDHMVYQDESYANMRDKGGKSFAPQGNLTAWFARKAGLGGRLCFAHWAWRPLTCRSPRATAMRSR